MSEQIKRARLEAEALVVGYAMSRMDARYLAVRENGNWKAAFAEAADALSIPAATLKNLRDEFDPLHSNSRRGWHKRMLRPSRQGVLNELKDLSDDGLMELVARLLKRDEEAIAPAIDVLAGVTRTAHNVAERLLTGRRAEEYFMAHSDAILEVVPGDLLDFRQAARGFDFGVRGRPEQAVEIKGLKEERGAISFTDREWTEAKIRKEDYWLVVVGNLSVQPVPRVVRNPRAVLEARCRIQTTIAAVWTSTLSVTG